MIIIVMGVSGAGKTTIGELLAQQLAWPFFDADTFHTPENIDKMSRGLPLSDEDRIPWLNKIRRHIEDLNGKKESAVIACSALKSDYRRILRGTNNEVRFVYLKGDHDLIQERLENRGGHFMKADLLESQFATLEEPAGAVTIDVSSAPDEIVREIRLRLNI